MYRLIPLTLLSLLAACGRGEPEQPVISDAPITGAPPAAEAEAPFEVRVDRFADVQVLRYQVPGFADMPLAQKKLAYFLSQAALAGWDIIWDQNYEHNLRVRRTLAGIIASYEGDRAADDYQALLEYAKRVWFANGIHHHYSSLKMPPGFDQAAFEAMVRASDPARLPLENGGSVDELLALLGPVLFDPTVAPKKVNLAPGEDLLLTSATNYYRDVSQAEAEAFYAARIDPDDPRPISWGLNSQLAKVDGELVERVWKIGGMYGPALEQVVYWLERALEVTENDAQHAWLEKLIAYYRSGDLRQYDDYNIAWVRDTDSRVDTVNGFTEVYGDPLGYRGAWEAMVSIRDLEASERIATLASNAQWFEDNSPLREQDKKPDVVGISAKVITIVTEGGDAAPLTPIGVNLPNANWIRKEHGSKSVTLGNIIEASEQASAESGLHDEFMLTEAEKDRYHRYGTLAYFLDVDLHEVIGHASGQIAPGVGTPKETLKNYASTLEETRADLVALYFMMDPKLVELGLMPSLEVGKTTYDRNIRNGLMIQLQRLQPGENLEQAHMRNRQIIASWALEKGRPGNVIEKVTRDGKTYFVIRDYEALRELFGQLLREVQRIKSEGDYEAGKALVETYGVKVDQAMYREVMARVEPLDIAPYTGFVQAELVPVEDNNELLDIVVEYPDDFAGQMLNYEENFSFLPVSN
ncbi:MAG: dihydrofolate reductase [Gammaproteobacteria bacterium]|jgi:dipeptidyl-peptidase-3